jgi:mono/diheme cytochrome c family protein
MLLAMFGAGCSAYSSFGFPVEQGDIEAGEQVFIDYRCHRCHTVAGVALPEIAGAASPRLELGGETSHVTAYSELVTSIINPNHKISDRYREQLTQRPTGPLETQMPMAHIETMTIRQLINLVAFLDSRYVLNPGYVYDFDDSDIAP